MWELPTPNVCIVYSPGDYSSVLTFPALKTSPKTSPKTQRLFVLSHGSVFTENVDQHIQLLLMTQSTGSQGEIP